MTFILSQISPLVILAALLAGIARGFVGFGAALIFVPLALATPGAAIAAPTLFLMDIVPALCLLPGAWRLAVKRDVALVIAGVLIGLPVGALALAAIPTFALRLGVLLVMVVLFVAVISKWRYRSSSTTAASLGAGGALGLLSGLAQAGDPLVAAYWLSRPIEPARIRANLILTFFVLSLIGAISFTSSGSLTKAVMAQALICAPFYGLGAFLGSLAFARATPNHFRWACLALIAIEALIVMTIMEPIRH